MIWDLGFRVWGLGSRVEEFGKILILGLKKGQGPGMFRIQ